jgi:hypothetical protein
MIRLSPPIHSPLTTPLTPEECSDVRTRPMDPTIETDLDDGSLDQEAFVDVFFTP